MKLCIIQNKLFLYFSTTLLQQKLMTSFLWMLLLPFGRAFLEFPLHHTGPSAVSFLSLVDTTASIVIRLSTTVSFSAGHGRLGGAASGKRISNLLFEIGEMERIWSDPPCSVEWALPYHRDSRDTDRGVDVAPHRKNRDLLWRWSSASTGMGRCTWLGRMTPPTILGQWRRTKRPHRSTWLLISCPPLPPWRDAQKEDWLGNCRLCWERSSRKTPSFQKVHPHPWKAEQ